MLDIIIPTYNNKQGLINTLNSINFDLIPKINVLVVDDCSSLIYEDIMQQFPLVNFLFLSKNVGPGMARQKGIECTSNPYITFIDTNDVFLSYEVQKLIIDNIASSPETVLFTYKYKNRDKISNESSNHLHGRIYKRDFLIKYNITFCEKSSYVNEDIGFNRLCKAIIKDKALQHIMYNIPIIDYVYDKDSITHKNNNEFFWKYFY